MDGVDGCTDVRWLLVAAYGFRQPNTVFDQAYDNYP